MKWNDGAKIFKKEKMVALWCNNILEKIPEENYEILCKIIDESIGLEELPDFFEIEDDSKYIISIIEMLKNRDIITYDTFDKKNTYEYKTATLILTNRCNLSCYHCCQDAVNEKFEESTTEDIFRIIDKMSTIKINDLTITGGEPLIRDDFKEIVKYISKNMDCKLSLLTNGTLLKDESAEFIARNFDSVSVSLDGTNNELTEIIRGKNLFDIIIKKVELLQSKKAKNISVSAVLPRIKKVEDEFYTLCIELNVVPILRSFSTTGRGSKGLKMITEAYLKYAEKYNLKFYDKYMVEALQNINSCSACIRNFTVDSFGNVYPCNLLLDDEFLIGNIISDINIFTKIHKWDKVEKLRRFQDTPCELCEYNDLCWHCISEFYTLGKDKKAFHKRCEIKKKTLTKLIWDN